MKRFFSQILHFSRAERAGTVALIIICGLVYLAPTIIHWLRPERATDFTQFQTDVRAFREKMHVENPATGESAGTLFAFDPNTATAEDFVRLGLSAKVAAIICNYRNKGGQFRQPDDLQKIYSLSAADFQRLRPWIQIGGAKREYTEREEEPTVATTAELFSFDPNLASEGDFRRLGLSSRTIKSILNYRIKGGQFRKKEDFAKIYTLSEEDYARLAPYMNISTLATTGAERPAMYAGGNAFPEKKFAPKGPIDINRAALEDWLRLPGIGEKRAQQIVKFRESLGGFLSVAQLAEMYNLPDSVFQVIQPLLTLEFKSIRQLNLNAATAEDLDRHPYISLKQATLIVNYRTQHGPFATVEDIGKIVAFTDKKWLEKIKPYLAVN